MMQDLKAVGAAVPEGYKQTEVGVIPEDWDVIQLGNYVDISSGESPSKFSFEMTGIPYFKVDQLNNGAVYAEITPYFVKIAKTIAAGSIIFPKRGASILSNKIRVLKHDSYMDTNLMTLTCAPGLEALYLYNQLTYRGLDSVADTTSIPQINNKHIYPYTIPFPSKTEQTAIAKALSDVDALISAQEELIAKKQAIKTATMQQLLSGRTRLPQFARHPDGTAKGTKPSELGEIPEDWEVACIKEVSFVDPENLGSTTSPDYEFNYISLEQVELGILLNTTRWTFSTAPSRARRVLRQNDVLISTVRPNLMSHYFVQEAAEDLICSTGFSVVRGIQDKLCPVYLYQHMFFSVINNQIDMLITGSNYPAINSTDVKNLQIPLGCMEEQTAIATILSDMDVEIQQLQQRLNKTRQIKQGMMQELLTGRIRLVSPQEQA